MRNTLCKSSLITPFIDATVNVITTYTSTDVTAGETQAKEDSAAFGVVSGLIGLAGKDVTGSLIVSFDEPSILDIVSKMLGETQHEINENVIDTVGEITNIICGGAKRDLEELGVSIDMATPTVFRGIGLEFTQTSPHCSSYVPFRYPTGDFFVEVNLQSAIPL